MKFVADLHLHSKYSRAVSQNMTLPNMAHWARLKGINVIATGDFTHPFWFDQLKKELEEAGNGLLRLKSGSDKSKVISDKSDANQEVYFLLSCEVSSIYSQGGKVRRIHNLFFFPSLAAVTKFNKKLLGRGVNLRSDGRPIVGIGARDLAEIALSCDKKALVIPAHVWTPWFSVFGAFSGFDSIKECFGDMAGYIYGIETGLSSDPAMNWQIGDLDKRAILSFSDAHSLEKMGREATVFEGSSISYQTILDAIKGTKGPSKIAFTIEFHPEEGKYHFTGHRDCGYSQGPEKSDLSGNTCPVCKRPLTVGVMDRVAQLKTRNQKLETRNLNGVRWVYHEEEKKPPYVSSVPLLEILAEALQAGVGTKTVMDQYMALVNTFGNELAVLLKAESERIRQIAGVRVAEAIDKVRLGNIVVEPGYDGKFGVVKIWQEKVLATNDQIEKQESAQDSQLNLFA